MDDQYAQLRRFGDQLASFNRELRRSYDDLHQRHDAVAPLWRDSFRSKYDQEWRRFDDSMSSYLKREASRYESFLKQKTKDLHRYLNG